MLLCAVFVVLICSWVRWSWFTHTTLKVERPAAMPLTCKLFMEQHYRQPSQVLGIPADKSSNVHFIRSRFAQVFNATSCQAGSVSEMQIICSAFLLLMNGASNTKAEQDMLHHQHRAAALTQHAQQLQDRLRSVWDAQQSCKELQDRLTVSQTAVEYFDAVLQFLGSQCIQGADTRVSSSELHEAFVRYIGGSGVQVPSQRDLRALLEHLGFEYGQVYVNGSNARGFRGLCLSRHA